MAARRRGDQPSLPVVRVAPPGELKAYTVYEHELDALYRGASGSLFLNFALCLLPISITLTVALLTTAIASDRLFQGFVAVATVTAIAGLVLLGLWWREHTGSRALITEIKDRLPPPSAIQRSPERGSGERSDEQRREDASREPPTTPT